MTATEATQQATQQAKETAQQAAGQARSRVRDEVDRRSTEAGEQATSVAGAIRQSAQQLREQGKEGAAKPIEQAADRVQKAGSWLRDSDGDRILRDAEDFGRRQPMAVIAGGIAIGFALSRLLKASSSKRYQDSSSGHAGELPRPGTTSGPYGQPASGAGATAPMPPTPPAAGPPVPNGAPAPGGVVAPDPVPPASSSSPPVAPPERTGF
jgi:hypothetical protein